MSGPAAFSVTGLVKRYGARTAVDQLSMSLVPAGIHGLLGPNGAGKSTTLRMLLGLVRPDQGVITWRGQPLGYDTPRGRCGVAGFADSPGFYPYLSASRNLELLSAWDGALSHARVEEMLELVGLSGRAQSKVRGFSTGMRQRLGLAAALISDPDVLIVDEPTSGLDPAGVRDLHALLVSIAGSGKTVLLSSHDLEEVERLCSDVTVLRDGAAVYSGTLGDLLARAGTRHWLLTTTDDEQALSLASGVAGLVVVAQRTGLQVRASQQDVDGYLLLLATRGVAVRGLVRDELSFQALYFQLTEAPP